MSSSTELPPADYEPRDASPVGIAAVATIVALTIALCLCVASILYLYVYHHARPPGMIGRQTSFHFGPEAKTEIAGDWIEQDAAVRRNLHTYGWIGRRHGIVRIPIDRAMDLLAREAARQPNAKGNAK